jgi:hypothetical protein
VAILVCDNLAVQRAQLEPDTVGELLRSPETLDALRDYVADQLGVAADMRWFVSGDAYAVLQIGTLGIELSSRGLVVGSSDRLLADRLGSELGLLVDELALGLAIQRTVDELESDPDVVVRRDEQIGAARVVSISI